MVRLVSRLAVTLTVLLASVLVFTTPAQAATTCWAHALSTGYGPVRVCLLTSGSLGRAALKSDITGQLSYQSGWVTASGSLNNQEQVTATDGVRALFIGGKFLNTPYGPASFGTQLTTLLGRFGWWNLMTNRFYPTSGWFARV